MADPIKIHAGKTPPRIHFIREWAERRHLRQADIVKEIGVDKGTVSRWFSGSLPAESSLLQLAALFQCDEPADLFRDPDDDWLSRFLKGRDRDEVERIRATLEAAFPRRVA